MELLTFGKTGWGDELFYATLMTIAVSITAMLIGFIFSLIFTPLKLSNNKFLNNIMITFDRGKFIREKNHYAKLMDNCDSIIIDDFYRMSFKQIFHYNNINLEKLYSNWKKTLSK